jgi:3-oxoacyl-[acyl-carrier-protein] synthase II
VRGLLAGESGIRPITQFDVTACRSRHAGRVVGFEATAYLPPLKLRRIDAVARVAIACVQDALDDARIARTAEGHDDVGVVLGSISAGVHATGEYLESFWKGGPVAAPAMLFSSTVGNAPASHCGLEYGLRGPNTTLMHKEASGLSALVFGAHLVRRGKAGAIVAGGADDIDERFYKVHDWFGVMAPSGSPLSGPAGEVRDTAAAAGPAPATAPFDANRCGFVMGEGGFMLVLEAEERAAARGATMLADVLGTGASSASLPVNAWPSDDEALFRCMQLALDDAGLRADDVDVVYASANGTIDLDRCEASALRRLFGGRAVPVTSVKGAIGEFSAAGAASLLAAILCGRQGLVAPTHGLDVIADDCPVAGVRTASPLPGSPSGSIVLINSFASGGTNFSLIARIRPA